MSLLICFFPRFALCPEETNTSLRGNEVWVCPHRAVERCRVGTHHGWGGNVDDWHGAGSDVVDQLTEDGAVGQGLSQILRKTDRSLAETLDSEGAPIREELSCFHVVWDQGWDTISLISLLNRFPLVIHYCDSEAFFWSTLGSFQPNDIKMTL